MIARCAIEVTTRLLRWKTIIVDPQLTQTVDDVGGVLEMLPLVKRYRLLFLFSVLNLNPSDYQHHRTAHPKTSCLPCGGRVFYEDALDQHYWDSVNHPSCIPCSSGFKDEAAYAEVRFSSQAGNAFTYSFFSARISCTCRITMWGGRRRRSSKMQWMWSRVQRRWCPKCSKYHVVLHSISI